MSISTLVESSQMQKQLTGNTELSSSFALAPFEHKSIQQIPSEQLAKLLVKPQRMVEQGYARTLGAALLSMAAAHKTKEIAKQIALIIHDKDIKIPSVRKLARLAGLDDEQKEILRSVLKRAQSQARTIDAAERREILSSMHSMQTFLVQSQRLVIQDREQRNSEIARGLEEERRPVSVSEIAQAGLGFSVGLLANAGARVAATNQWSSATDFNGFDAFNLGIQTVHLMSSIVSGGLNQGIRSYNRNFSTQISAAMVSGYREFESTRQNAQISNQADVQTTRTDQLAKELREEREDRIAQNEVIMKDQRVKEESYNLKLESTKSEYEEKIITIKDACNKDLSHTKSSYESQIRDIRDTCVREREVAMHERIASEKTLLSSIQERENQIAALQKTEDKASCSCTIL